MKQDLNFIGVRSTDRCLLVSVIGHRCLAMAAAKDKVGCKKEASTFLQESTLVLILSLTEVQDCWRNNMETVSDPQSSEIKQVA